ncbi:MAG: hypothetical protein MSG80_01085, partial [Campylobacter sp.]|nr:hypothetical protein [Campylobacter sp.]
RIYRDGNTDVKVPLKGIVCASNEFPPANQGLEALYDRMILRYFVKPLEERESFDKLLFEYSPICEKVSNAFELSELENIQAKSKKITFSPEAKELIHAIKGAISFSYTSTQSTNQSSEQTSNQAKQNSQTVGANQAPYISDRRWKQCAELLQIAALLSDREQVIIQDVVLLRHALWENESQVELVKDIIANNILMLNKENEIVAAIKDDYKKLSQIIDKAPKLEHKEIATELGQRATNAIEAIKDEYLKEKISANPFLSADDVEFAYSDYTQNIKELQNIALGTKELEEKIASEDTKEIAKKKIIDEFDKKLDKLLVNTKLQSRDVIFENVFDGIASLVSNSSSVQVNKDDFNRAKKDRTKQKIKECAQDILLGKKDFNSLDEDDFVFTGETNNSITLALSAVAPLVGADRGVSNYILEEKAKKREGELKPIKALIKKYKAKIDEIK